MCYPPSNFIYESREMTWLHMFYYLPQPGTNLDIKVRESAGVNNDERCVNLDTVDDEVINNNNIIDDIYVK